MTDRSKCPHCSAEAVEQHHLDACRLRAEQRQAVLDHAATLDHTPAELATLDLLAHLHSSDTPHEPDRGARAARIATLVLDLGWRPEVEAQ